MKKLKFIYFLLTQLDFIQTLRFNFKMLPFKQAIRFPFYFYGKVKFGSLDGKVTLNTDFVHPGIYRFGENVDFYPHGNQNSYFHLAGNLELSERFEIGNQYSVFIAKNAELILENKIFIGQNVKIVCFKKIAIGYGSRIAWECQIIDSNFHYTENITTKKINNRHGEIYIGQFNWIGNRTTIMKGTHTNDYLIVTSNSLLNKSYFNIESYSMVGGIPAQFIKAGIKRVFDLNEENKYIGLFNEPW